MITRRVTRYLTPSEPNFLLWSFFIQRVWEIYGFLFDSRLHILVSIGLGFYLAVKRVNRNELLIKKFQMW